MMIQIFLFIAMPLIVTALRSLRNNNNVRLFAGMNLHASASASTSVIDEAEISENIALKQLKALGIESTTYKHAAVFTVDEQSDEVASIPGSQTKNLFLKDKKHGLYLITALA